MRPEICMSIQNMLFSLSYFHHDILSTHLFHLLSKNYLFSVLCSIYRFFSVAFIKSILYVSEHLVTVFYYSTTVIRFSTKKRQNNTNLEILSMDFSQHIFCDNVIKAFAAIYLYIKENLSIQ